MQTASATYLHRRGELETYFDRTANDAWAKLTSDAPVSGVRATVRAGRDEMRTRLLSWLGKDLCGRTVLDAGCGPGQLAVEAARHGAAVTAVDLSPRLLALAEERVAETALKGSVAFTSGDMLTAGPDRVDHVVMMDVLIHYSEADIVRTLSAFAARTNRSILFTVAPRTPLLTVMHAVGSFFPKGDRAPGIKPVTPAGLSRRIGKEPSLAGWSLGRSERTHRGFYISHALELRRDG